MKKIVVGLLVGLGSGAIALGIVAARRAPVVQSHVSVAGIDLGGLTVEDAGKKLRVWWEEEKLKPLTLQSVLLKAPLPVMHASELGVTIDDMATVTKLPMRDVLGDVKETVGLENLPAQSFDPILKYDGIPPAQLEDLIKKADAIHRPARAVFYKGAVVTIPEAPKLSMKPDDLVDAVSKAIKADMVVQLPIAAEPKKIPDEELAKITDVVSEFHTHFPAHQTNRNANIRLASARLNGVVLLPGEKMSFNGTVGQRTERGGFKLAGVYKNGKHDTGIGGGICQVSTTLYNASLFGNLKIVRRSNHSMPVAYVPLGRDATVDYGSLDLVIQNNYSTPISISSEFQPGTLTFRVLGKKDPTLSIKMIQVGSKSWDNHVEIVQDPKLKPGEREVVEKGSRGHSITTYRLIYKSGVLVTKEYVSHSYYGGGDKIIDVGPAIAAAPIVRPGAPAQPATPISAIPISHG